MTNFKCKMAATRSRFGMPVLALKRPKHEVELFNFALHNDCVLVASERTSTCFICYQIINEFLQNESEKWAVILMDDNSGLDTDPLIKTLDQLLPSRPVVFPDVNEATSLQHRGNQHVLLTSANHLHQCITKGYIHASNICVVIHLATLTTNVVALHNPPAILKTLCKEDVKPRIIGLMQLALNNICNALDFKTQLDFIEATYNLPIFMSKDLLAMNGYGEEIAVKVLPYCAKSLSPIERNILKILNELSDFLRDINVADGSESIRNLRAVIAWSLDVLMIFGLWSLSFRLECIQNTFSSLLSKENCLIEVLAIEACNTQFDFIQKLVFSREKTPEIHSCLMYEILDQLVPYQAYCITPATSCELREQTPCGTGQEAKFEAESLVDKTSLCESKDAKEEVNNTDKSQGKETMKNNMSSDKPEVVAKRKQKLKVKSQFHCIIVTRSNSFARMLSKLINYISSGNEKYKFMKSGCVVHSKNASAEEQERTESVLQAVLQGMVNIVVTTVDLYLDLSLRTFNVLVYFGVPTSYQEYYQVKNKIKGLAPKLMLLFNDHCSAECERNLQVFRDIELEIAKRVSDYASQENKEQWLKCLRKEAQSSYAPFGEEGPSVLMESSIHVINRYCRRINRGDFCNLYAQFITEKREEETENCVEFVSKLYLPLSSYCCTIVEGPPVRVTKENDQDLQVGILKSRMLASLECVKVLHSTGKMDDDLDLTEEVYVDANNQKLQSFELEDEGKGRAGTNKRKRAYGIKAPSFFEDNMPRANETSFLYKIQFKDPTIYKHSKSGSLHTLVEPEFELGILSRKPLPKMPPFFIYTCISDVSASLEASGPVKIDETMLHCIRLFHHYVFKELHKLDYESTTLSESDGYLAVPLLPSTTPIPCDTFRINRNFLQGFASFFQSISDPGVELKPAPPCAEFSFFQNKIVQRLNGSAHQTHYTRYFVVKVCEDLSPASPFPDQEVATTFADYYQNRYGISVSLEQPLLLVMHVPTQVNFIIPRLRQQDGKPGEEGGTSSVKEKGPRSEIHLIPELCFVLPLSVSAWSLARYLPAVGYRLEALLRAHEMKLRIYFEAGISLCPNTSALFEVGLCEKENCGYVGERRFDDGVWSRHSCHGDVADNGDDVNGRASRGHDIGGSHCSCSHGDGGDGRLIGGDDIGVCACHDSNGDFRGDNVAGGSYGGCSDGGCSDSISGDDVGPSTSIILHALTAKSAGQQFHSEQLEVLGDSCLKLEVSLELFISDPKRDEWTLSVYRQQLVSNDMLSTQGRRLGIPGYISITPPDLTNTSLPPGFILEPSRVMKKSWLNLYTHHVLGDKHVANCVEALLAAVLVSCGRNAAREFLTWLGVTRCTSSELRVLFQRLEAQTTQDLQDQRTVSQDLQDQRTVGQDLRDQRTVSQDLQDQRTVSQDLRDQTSQVETTQDQVLFQTGSVVEREIMTENVMDLQVGISDPGIEAPGIAEEILKSGHLQKLHGQNDLCESTEGKHEIVSHCLHAPYPPTKTETLPNYHQPQITKERNRSNIRSSCNRGDAKELSSENSKHLENKNMINARKAKSEHLKFPTTRPMPNFENVETALGYHFKNKRLLLKALTHNSYPRLLSMVSETYQRTEFLGDAILDYLVTWYLFEHFPQLNHGDVTDFRSALVNNFTLAFLAVQKNLHQSLRHISPPLLHVITQFLEYLEEQKLKQGASWQTSVDAFVVGKAEESLVEVPKVLGDVFEAVVCAVFLDSGMDLKLVWEVFRPMFMPFIDYYKDNLPLSPVRLLKETFPDSDKVTFSLARLTLSRRYKSSVLVAGYGKFEAVGRTPKIAKASVARKALQHIRNLGTTTS